METKDCRFDSERLSRFIDAAPAAQDRATAEHLRGCAECRRRLEESRRIDDEIAQLDLPGWNDATAKRFTAKVMARITAPPQATEPPRLRIARPRQDPRVPTAWLAATLSAAAAILLVVGSDRVERPREEASDAPPAERYWVGKEGKFDAPDGFLGESDRAQTRVDGIYDSTLGLAAESGPGMKKDARGWYQAYGRQARTVDADPAVAVDQDELTCNALAASEAVVTLLTNSSHADAEGLSQLRDAIVLNGMDDRVRTVIDLVSDPEVARPLERMQVLLVRLANPVRHDPEEVAELKQAVLGGGLIEEVRLSRARVPTESEGRAR